MGCTLLLGALVEATPQKATLAGFHGPHCILGDLLGEEACPGCGLTRSTALAIQGRLDQSLSVHPAGIAIFLLCIGGILIHGHILAGRRRTGNHDLIIRWGVRGWVVLLLASWLYRILDHAVMSPKEGWLY